MKFVIDTLVTIGTVARVCADTEEEAIEKAEEQLIEEYNEGYGCEVKILKVGDK